MPFVVAEVDTSTKTGSPDVGQPAEMGLGVKTGSSPPKGATLAVLASDEHGVLELTPESQVALGDVLWLVPGHCDPTVNLYDELIGVRHGRVASIWPISARGALL